MAIRFYAVIVPFLLALLTVVWIHPKLVRIALMKSIVDNPDARKLQRTPVPVLGGTAVFFGVTTGIGLSEAIIGCPELFVVVTAMLIMLYTGTMDDILSLSPALRFLIEIATVLLLVFVGNESLSDFHGLWGITTISAWVAVPLTVFASVGIINAINLIDGVDGLSSGFCIMASIMFGVVFAIAGDISMTILAAVSAGALIPFFFHNVFGKTSKMFIGDGGTLVMGIVMSVFVLNVLQSETPCEQFVDDGLGLIPFTLAVLSVPVFDTLRVMSARILHGTSPFHPDKTHLHHLFIEMGFSHAGTTVCILSLDTLVVLCWWTAYLLGASIDWQLYIVVAMSLAITFAFYETMKLQQCRNTSFYRFVCRIGTATHIERQGICLQLQKFVDRI